MVEGRNRDIGMKGGETNDGEEVVRGAGGGRGEEGKKGKRGNEG